jgi:hypothetical protein
MPKATHAFITTGAGTPAGHPTDPAPAVREIKHTRRRLLAGAAAGVAATVAALPVVAGAVTVQGGQLDPHPTWLAEWKAAVAYLDGDEHPPVDCLSELPEWHRSLELEELIGTTPARTIAAEIRDLGAAYLAANEAAAPEGGRGYFRSSSGSQLTGGK